MIKLNILKQTSINEHILIQKALSISGLAVMGSIHETASTSSSSSSSRENSSSKHRSGSTRRAGSVAALRRRFEDSADAGNAVEKREASGRRDRNGGGDIDADDAR